MKYTINFIVLVEVLFFCIASVSAQTVTNITVEQVGKTIQVSYDLDKQADITLFVSTDGGSTYTQLYRVSGDVGKNISAGHKTIVWDVLVEREKLKGDDIVFKVKAAGNCPYTLTDYDGNTYRTVKIGEQCWMRENLRTTHYASGTSISHGTKGSKDYAYYFYPADYNTYNDEKYVPEYGLLYNWWAVMRYAKSSKANPSGVQGVCPNGWHIPSVAEWNELLNYVGSRSEYICVSGKDSIVRAMADNVCVWKSWLDRPCETCNACYNLSLNNKTGFSAKPAGYYSSYVFKLKGQWYGPTLHWIGEETLFWSTTQCGKKDAWALLINSRHLYFSKGSQKDNGYSVRCVKND